MPCLNEAETLETCIRKASASIEALGVPGEVLIADNGSTDGSQEIARRAGARVVDVPVRGYGAALQAGIVAARGRFVIMGDADDSYDFTSLGPFLDELRAGGDLVMGNRFAGGIAPGAMPPLHRYLGNPVLSFVGRLFFRSPIKDFHCGLRGFKRDAIAALDLRTTGMEFASEMVVRAQLAKLDLREVPTTLQPDGRSRPPHLRSWRDGWRHLRFLLLYSPRWLFLYPGFVLILLGLAAMVALLPGKRVIGDVAFDVQTLMFAGGAVVVGFQAVVFAVLTKVFGITQGLLPTDVRIERMFKFVRLETGLLVGAFLLIVGLGGSIAAFAHWSSKDFGAIDFTSSMRVLVPSLVALMLGFETVLASFFLSVLGLPKR
ncbi:MAG TPA: glycosyltransferase family 2 protein [Mycobacteriales bacterium]|nr:glycosyltransferase family 2 protein [Mycobacteriales bacterium]